MADVKTGRKKIEERPEIILPQMGIVLVSDFIRTLSPHIVNIDTLFYREGDDSIVEYTQGQLRAVKPSRAVSLIEKCCVPGYIHWDETKKTDVFDKKSAPESLCRAILDSPELKAKLPLIKRILLVPIPFLNNGMLVFPKRGYNPDLQLYMDMDAPEIDPNVSLEDAKKTILSIFKEFCFKSENDLFRSVASLLTPFLRGLYSQWNTRSPLYIYFANRERAGKDYNAVIRLIVFCGHATEEPPVCTGKSDQGSNDELRKKLLSSLIAGKSLLHFSNNKGHINNSVLEQVSTAKQYSDRILGGNKIATFDNTLEISLSANMGTTVTADLDNRSQKIYLHLAIENANERNFETPNLHDVVLQRRDYILSCLYALVRNWNDNGRPSGNKLFASFPEWAAICGGIIESAGWPNPIANDDKSVISLDTEMEDMREAFLLAYEKWPEKFISKSDFKKLIAENNDTIFSGLNLEDKSGQTKLGYIIDRYAGRELSGITMVIDETQKRKARQQIKFTKERQTPLNMSKYMSEDGNLGNVGNLVTPYIGVPKIYIYKNTCEVAKVAKVTKDEPPKQTEPKKSILSKIKQVFVPKPPKYPELIEIINKIDKESKGQGAHTSDIAEELKTPEELIKQRLNYAQVEGEVYEYKPGYWKVAP